MYFFTPQTGKDLKCCYCPIGKIGDVGMLMYYSWACTYCNFLCMCVNYAIIQKSMGSTIINICVSPTQVSEY